MIPDCANVVGIVVEPSDVLDIPDIRRGDVDNKTDDSEGDLFEVVVVIIKLVFVVTVVDDIFVDSAGDNGAFVCAVVVINSLVTPVSAESVLSFVGSDVTVVIDVNDSLVMPGCLGLLVPGGLWLVNIFVTE